MATSFSTPWPSMHREKERRSLLGDTTFTGLDAKETVGLHAIVGKVTCTNMRRIYKQ